MTKKELVRMLSLFKDDEDIKVCIKWNRTYANYTEACIKKVIYTMEDGCLKTVITFRETDRNVMAA